MAPSPPPPAPPPISTSRSPPFFRVIPLSSKIFGTPPPSPSEGGGSNYEKLHLGHYSVIHIVLPRIL